MNLDILLTILLIFFFFFDKNKKLQSFLLRYLIELKYIIKNSLLYILILLIFLILFFEKNILMLSFLINFYYIYKFLIYYFYKKLLYNYNKIIFMIIVLINFYYFNFIITLIIFIFFIDFFVCIQNCNTEYDLAFSGFTEELFKIKLTANGKFKINEYFKLLIFKNVYFYEELKSNFYYKTDIDYFYENYNDNYK